VLYNAIDTSELISPMADSESNPEIIKLIYVGRISREKGLDVLFKAFQLLRKSGKQAKLTILGKERGSDVPENYREQLLKLAEKVFRNDIKFKGHLKHVDNEILQNSIVIVPSIVEESFGRVVLEGLRLGKPVICSRIGGMQEIFGGEEFFMFHPGGEKALKEKIEQVIQNPQKTTLKMEQLQQRMKAKFSYTNYADQWIEKVRNLI
jgi:glycosyltransferase involved in cell wall biosynthesis